MLTPNIKFNNFKKKISKKKIKFTGEKWFKKIKLLDSLGKNYKYNYIKKDLKKFKKKKKF
tara:strand:- start:354 stop:533 length:180 start_codon:yes stop_codon:yes gene_type:complete